MLSGNFLILILYVIFTANSANGWSSGNQFHIQTDEGPQRYFRYQTDSGQYRKEKRLEDGTVVGTYAWIDDDGFLHQRDYIADNAGYRILKSKKVHVGRNIPVGDAVKAAKKYPASSGTLVKTNIASTHRPIVEKPVKSLIPTIANVPNEQPLLYLPSQNSTNSLQDFSQASISSSLPYQPQISSISSNLIPQASYLKPNEFAYDTNPYVAPLKKEVYFQNGPTYPIDRQGQEYRGQRIGDGYNPQYPYYDGVSVTNDGFRYYIPRAYHEEQTVSESEKTGSFGYIDPFGIRRVIYYNTSPGGGFQHKKNNRYVGFDATPYDPRPY